MASKYDAASIEVLSGLDPVRKRPGMYTDTTRPNHLAQEVVDSIHAVFGEVSPDDIVELRCTDFQDQGRSFSDGIEREIAVGVFTGLLRR